MAAERKINGTIYRADMLPADQGLDLFLRVTKVFKAAPELMGALASGKSDQDATGRFMTLVFSDDLNREETGDLLRDLVKSCHYTSPSGGVDPCIVGIAPVKLADIVKVAWFAMEVQFRDFWPKVWCWPRSKLQQGQAVAVRARVQGSCSERFG